MREYLIGIWFFLVLVPVILKILTVFDVISFHSGGGVVGTSASAFFYYIFQLVFYGLLSISIGVCLYLYTKFALSPRFLAVYGLLLLIPLSQFGLSLSGWSSEKKFSSASDSICEQMKSNKNLSVEQLNSMITDFRAIKVRYRDRHDNKILICAIESQSLSNIGTILERFRFDERGIYSEAMDAALRTQNPEVIERLFARSNKDGGFTTASPFLDDDTLEVFHKFVFSKMQPIRRYRWLQGSLVLDEIYDFPKNLDRFFKILSWDYPEQIPVGQYNDTLAGTILRKNMDLSIQKQLIEALVKKGVNLNEAYRPQGTSGPNESLLFFLSKDFNGSEESKSKCLLLIESGAGLYGIENKSYSFVHALFNDSRQLTVDYYKKILQFDLDVNRPYINLSNLSDWGTEAEYENPICDLSILHLAIYKTFKDGAEPNYFDPAFAKWNGKDPDYPKGYIPLKPEYKSYLTYIDYLKSNATKLFTRPPYEISQIADRLEKKIRSRK